MAHILCGTYSRDFASFRERAARAACGFASLGVREGDTVALLMRNDIAFLEASVGIGQAGAYAVPINWHSKSEELDHVLSDSAAKVVVAHSDFASLLTSFKDLQVVWVRTPAEVALAYGLEAAATEIDSAALEWETWLAQQVPGGETPRRARGVIVYTSGTTGKPKGVQRMPFASAAQERSMADFLRRSFGVRENVRTVLCGPLYHAMPNVQLRSVLGTIGPDGLIVVEPRFDAERLLQLIEKYRINQLVMAPVMFYRLLKLPENKKGKYDLSSLEYVIHSGAPCPYQVKRDMIAWWGPVIHEFYGTTESGMITLVDTEDWLRKPGTVGRPMAESTVKIIAESGNEMPAGEPGEICAVNRLYSDFTYRNLDKERHKLDCNRLIKTGDIGYLDADGFLFLCDRKKDMVISGGVNIYPAEIEGALHSMSTVSDCAVFGIPDEEYGEALAAHIELIPGAPANEEDIRTFLGDRLSRFKIPRVIRFESGLPRDDNGKIYKRRLSEPYWAGVGRRI